MKEIMLDKELKSKGIDTEIKDKMVGEKGNLTIVKYGEDHYVLLRDAIFKHLDKLGTLDKKKAYINTQRSRYKTISEMSSTPITTAIVSFLTGKFFDKIDIHILFAILVFLFLEIYLTLNTKFTSKYNFYLLLLDDVEENYFK